MNIGVFDSGIGGLTVLKAFVRELPNYTYKYFGDNANAPYGEKTPEEIYALTIRGIEFLFAKNCSLVVLACNTASTVLPRIQQEWLPKYNPGKKVLGIIRPTAEDMISQGEKDIILMATPATVSAKSYDKEITKLGGKINIRSIACPELAKAIEDSGGNVDSNTKILLNRYLENIKPMMPLYLGCTHYELLEEEIKEISNCKIFHQSNICALALSKYLKKHEGELELTKKSDTEIFASQNQECFGRLASTILA